MSKKVLISADSTCDLSPELCAKYNVKIKPLPIIRDGESLLDGVNITPEQVFEHYQKTGKLIRTSAANAEEYKTFFDPFLDEGYEIIHFTISSNMSAANNVCNIVAEETPDLYVVDSRNLSTGIGLLVLKAAEFRDNGLSAKEIKEKILPLCDKVDASFTLDTLEYLHKGGRCSAVAALGANLLRLKPCIEVKNGTMGVGKKYRGKLEDVLNEYVIARLHDPEDIDTTRIFITHSVCSADLVERTRKQIESIMHFDEILDTDAGCSISVHCGPNTVGVLFIRKTPLAD